MGIVDPTTGLPVASVASLDRSALWFRAHLADQDVRPVPGSAFDLALRDVERVAYLHREEVNEQPIADDTAMIRRAFGLDFMIKAIHRTLPKTASAFGPFWRIFKGTDVCLATASSQSQERDTAWELIVAALLARFGKAVAMVEPPDVSFEFEGYTWGVACKILYSNDVDNQIDRIVEGAKQIERSQVDFGLVAVNITSVVNHTPFLEAVPNQPTQYKGYVDTETAHEALRRQCMEIVQRINPRRLTPRLESTKDGQRRMKTRVVVFFAQTVAGCSNHTISNLPIAISFDFRPISIGENTIFERFGEAVKTTFQHTLPAVT